MFAEVYGMVLKVDDQKTRFLVPCVTLYIFFLYEKGNSISIDVTYLWYVIIKMVRLVTSLYKL